MMGGVRATAFGKTIASNPRATLTTRKTHVIGLEARGDGTIILSLDEKPVLEAKVDLPGRIGPIDVSTRSSDARWEKARGWNLTFDPADPLTFWILQKDEPIWHPEEAITNGYQPVPSHLWNRWLGNLLPSPGEWPTISFVDEAGPCPTAPCSANRIRTRSPSGAARWSR